MRIQLALDRLNKRRCFQLVEATKEYVDWIEIGTGVIKEYGMEIIREMKEHYPEKVLVADMKTCDAGEHEAKQAFEAGADITTVMAFSANQTITAMLQEARASEKQLMVDLLGVSDQKRIEELAQLGVEWMSLHFGKDMQQQGEGLTEAAFSAMKGLSGVSVAVAGGIAEETLPRIMLHKPETVIVGSAITKAEHPGVVARRMKEVIEDYEVHH
ncbi:3-hexulose-6-phosphate synthase [Pontibacillus salicampi]|uniref:3-hexulose-6-phosphate synthase n=1 Tax=Pontibacillus salicampi TaxID=1449801 RepID=A0ABV6LR15_9BACI